MEIPGGSENFDGIPGGKRNKDGNSRGLTEISMEFQGVEEKIKMEIPGGRDF